MFGGFSMCISKLFGRSLLVAIAILLTFSSTQAYAEVFKASEFLKWERKNQEFYIETSIGMGALIIAQYDEPKAKCVSDAFNENDSTIHDRVLKAMSQFPEYHPRATIFAILEKMCGDIGN